MLKSFLCKNKVCDISVCIVYTAIDLTTRVSFYRLFDSSRITGSSIAMTSESRSLRVSCSIYAVTCFIGLIVQSSYIIKLYSEYKVSTTISVTVPEKLEPKPLTMCIRYTDILDFNKLNRHKRTNWSLSSNVDDVRKYQHELTIEEVFNFTPKAESVVSGVRFRNDSKYFLYEFNDIVRPLDPFAFFELYKFLYLEYVCYAFKPKFQFQLPYRSLSETTVAPGFIYWIIFKNLDLASLIKVSIYGSSLPRRSLMFIPVSTRISDKGLEPQFNITTGYLTSLEMFSLEPPYETKCFNYSTMGVEHDLECTQRCVEKKTKEVLGKMPFSTLILNASDLKIVSYIDLNNASISSKVAEIEHNCSSQECSRWPCEYIVRFTHMTTIPGKPFRFEEMTPIASSMEIKSKEAFAFVEFLTYLLSVIATWTGLSIMSFNPREVVKSFNEAKKVVDTSKDPRFRLTSRRK